jgi:hypothetical protein
MYELLIEKRAGKGFKKIPADTAKRLITKNDYGTIQDHPGSEKSKVRKTHSASG